MTQRPTGEDILAACYQATRTETEARRQVSSVEDLAFEFADKTASFADALKDTPQAPDVAVIAEHKRRSPSRGDIRPDSTVEWTVDQYSKGGAAAVSILTQQHFFGGLLSDLADASAASSMPILRKDFIDDPYQLYEARAYGAHAVLLIVAGLTDVQLRDLQHQAEEIDLDCLVEVHDERELERAIMAEASIIGVNNRNLSTLKEDISVADRLIPQIPDGIIAVAESGYSVDDDDHMRRLRKSGAAAVLMGTALMEKTDPAVALAAWLATE